MNQITKAKNLYEFIDLTKVRTAMYIGDESLSALYFCIGGYYWACGINGTDEKLQPDFSLFHDFVANYYLYRDSTAGWKNIILAENFGDEKRALKEFYKLFDMFRTMPKIINAKKILFKILDQLINGTILTKISNEQLSISLKDLAHRLEESKFYSNYKEILSDLEELAKSDKTFDFFLNDIKNT
ncbi:hypothetical protein CA265_17340 [Sphingobacteriaceae bacterium GW460-11-11-14-LB5]|nr:hypothetical protein CA265_17340 [Sphingobacteriaceae bacterium GW460-11-11-14-LB5]